MPRPVLLGLLGGLCKRPGHRGCRVASTDLPEPFDGLGLTGRPRPRAHQHRAGRLLRVTRQIPLHDEASERGAEHYRCVQAEQVDQLCEVVGPGAQVPLTRGAKVAAAVTTLVEDDDLGEGADRLQREAQEPPVESRPAVHPDHGRTSSVTDPLIPCTVTCSRTLPTEILTR